MHGSGTKVQPTAWAPEVRRQSVQRQRQATGLGVGGVVSLVKGDVLVSLGGGWDEEGEGEGEEEGCR
jgi:hypothetical protein